MRRVWCVLCLTTAGCLVPSERFAPLDPEPPVDHLAQAADALGRDDTTAAVRHFTIHLADHPDEHLTRLMLADVLVRTNQLAEARREYERFIADVQVSTNGSRKHLVDVHTRLTRIAMATGDSHAECLHRGIGLWRIVADDPDNELTVPTLMKAVAALKEAVELRPSDRRSWFYLAEVYGKLGQASSTRVARRCARAGPPIGLTPWEQDCMNRWPITEG